MARSTVYLPDGLPQRAHAVGINVSRVAANAVEDAVQKLEKPKETPEIRQDTTGAVRSMTTRQEGT